MVVYDIVCIIKYDICRLIIAVEDSGTGIDLVKQNKILSDNSELKRSQFINLRELMNQLNIDLLIFSTNSFKAALA